MRYFIEIGYDGTYYHGWQSQANAVSIQGKIEEILQQLLGKKILITGSSRTDAGVHCIKQFFHLDVTYKWDIPSMKWKLNSMLPKDIAIHTIKEVKSDFHARYDAIQRHYEYWITQYKNPFSHNYTYHFYNPIDIYQMNKAAVSLVGKHDFKSFSKIKTNVNHFICNLSQAQWKKKGDVLIFYISANRFLRGMVRTIVGSLLDVGTGRITHQKFEKIIHSKDRRCAGSSAPPQGLYLVNVEYPNQNQTTFT